MAKPEKEPKWKEAWRPAAAYLYMLICFADFIAFPAYYAASNRNNNNAVVEQALKFKDGANQVEVLKALKRDEVWVPLTTTGAGMVHLAFLSILGVAAWTRGQEKIMLAQQQPVKNDTESDMPQ